MARKLGTNIKIGTALHQQLHERQPSVGPSQSYIQHNPLIPDGSVALGHSQRSRASEPGHVSSFTGSLRSATTSGPM